MKKRARKSGKVSKSRRKAAKRVLLRNPKLLIYSFLAVIITSFIGTRFTDTSEWYESIKPVITPPNYVFGIVWTTLFILIALAIYFSLSNANKKQNKLLINLFAINLVLNIFWSALFFGAQNVSFAFVDLILLWISIIVLIHFTWKISKLSAWLLLPYAIWVSFAGLLNYLMVFY